jgi:plastocyanin
MVPGAKRVAMGGGSTASRLPGPSRSVLIAPATAMVLLIGACGGGSSGGGPTTPPSASPTTPPTGNNPTVTITAAGAVSPKNIDVALGGRVTFVNQDNVNHEIDSDPHPVHTDCPPINQVDVLTPGQSKDTGVFTVGRVCGYHDHGDSSNTNLQGTITIK